MNPLKAVGAGALTLATLTCVCSTAQAYCQMSTLQTQDTSAGCSKEGFLLEWRNLDLEFLLNANAFDRLDEATMRGEIEASLKAWEEVNCGPDETHDMTLTLLPGTATEDGPLHDLSMENENIIMFRTAQQWRARGYSSDAFALTEVWFNVNNGEILGADMELNDGRGPYGVCPDESGCSTGSLTTDLRNVVTHEVGHVVGLAHSEDANATMFFSADPGDVDKRTLAADDIAGFCDIYGLTMEEREAREQERMAAASSSGGCSAGPDGQDSTTAPWWLAGLAFVRFCRRRRR